MALNTKNRLKKKKDFERVFKKGKAIKGNFLFAKYLTNESGLPRMAFVVSSKVSKKAVTRNKIRRILSEISRLQIKDLGPVDVVIIAERKIVEAPREDIDRDLAVILNRIK